MEMSLIGWKMFKQEKMLVMSNDYTPAKQMFYGGVLESACLFIHVSVSVSVSEQNSICQSPGGCINPFPNDKF